MLHRKVTPRSKTAEMADTRRLYKNMSASSSKGVRFGIWGFFKGLFHRADDSDLLLSDDEVSTEAGAELAPPPIEVAPPAAAAGKPAPAAASQNLNVDVQDAGVAPSVAIPLQAILNGFPNELRGRVRVQTVGDLSINVPADKILSQLPQGQVRLPFGEIRKSAPQVFSPGVDYDRISVALPLNEVLSRLNPGVLLRRSQQRHRVEIPEEITSPFDGRGAGLSVGNATPVQPAAPRKTAPEHVLPERGPISSVPPVPTPKPKAKVVLPPEMEAIPALFGPKAAAPVAPSHPSTPPAPEKTSVRMTVPPPRPAAPTAAPVLPPAPAIPMPAAAAALPANPPAAASSVIYATLRALSESWPEAVLREITQAGLGDAKVALPVDQVETALKRGRIVYPWKLVRSWITPAAPATISAHDAAELELPLKVVAPLFLSRKHVGQGTAGKAAVGQDIPDLFFNGAPKAEPTPPAPAAKPVPAAPVSPIAPAPALPPQPVAPPAPSPAKSVAPIVTGLIPPRENAAAAPEERTLKMAETPGDRIEDTNFYLWSDASETTRLHLESLKKTGAKGTEFAKRYSSPNEIVERAIQMPGVAGALVALPDGLMVASRIPAEFNGDTLAAFLPQIFVKVNSTAKELRMGELNNVSFTVGTTPWKIFRVNAIFFAAFGRDAQPMPTAQLAGLAAELDRKNK